MAFSYKWSDGIAWLKAYARNIPVAKIDAQACDAVSSELWSMYPWKDTCQTLPTYTLLDGVQDYDSPPTFFRLISGQITRTLPGDAEAYDPLDVVENLPINYRKVHPSGIRLFGSERGVGLIRLSARPIVESTEEFLLDGTYQFQHTRVIDVNSPCWFKDQLWHVAQEGLLYHGYKLGDKPMSAVAAQYDVFRSKAREAWQQEDAFSSDSIYPMEGSIGGWGP